MSKLVIIGTIKMQPGSRDTVLKAVLEHRERCLRDEPGTISFEVPIPEGDTMLMVYEVYAAAQAFETHWNGPSMMQERKDVGAKIISITGVRCKTAEPIPR